MSKIIAEVDRLYQHMNEWSDIRTKDYPIASSPVAVFAIVAFYVYFCKVLGPRLMENKKPFELNRTIMVYNIFQIIFNLWMFIKIVSVCWMVYDWRCEPIDYTYSDHSIQVAQLAYIYFLNKLADLLDTIFFVLRKKNKQITFLHVYHHAGMLLATAIAVKFLPGGQASFLGGINSLVHCIMYSYYFLTSWKPENKRFIWWKKYITQMQMVQFLLIFLHQTQPLYVANCAYPKWVGYLLGPQNFFMLFLFTDFYIKAYIKKKQS